MRKRVLAFASIVVISLAASTVSAGVLPQADVRTASAEEHALARADAPVPLKPAAPRGVEDLRDSAALVLVGSMLIGLAAAVRRTA